MKKKIAIVMLTIACLGIQADCKAEETENQITVLNAEENEKEEISIAEGVFINQTSREENEDVLENAVAIGLCDPISSPREAEECFGILANSQIAEGEQNKWFKDLLNQEDSVEKNEKLRELFPEYDNLVLQELKQKERMEEYKTAGEQTEEVDVENLKRIREQWVDEDDIPAWKKKYEKIEPQDRTPFNVAMAVAEGIYEDVTDFGRNLAFYSRLQFDKFVKTWLTPHKQTEREAGNAPQ